MQIDFKKYKESGDIHWQEAFSFSPLKFNAYLSARYKMVLGFLGDVNGKTVADIGAGDCALASLIAKNGANIIMIDNSSDGMEFGRKNFNKRGLKGEFLLADVYNIPLPDISVDSVVSSDVIEHLDNPEAHLKEAARILKNGGFIVISTPYRLSENPHDPYHIHEFYPDELIALVGKYFTDIEIKESHHIFWFSFYGFKFPFTKFPVMKYLINAFVLLTGKNPFLKYDSKRGKRDYFTQITCSGVKK